MIANVLARLNRLQNGRSFKTIASIVLLLAAIAAFISLWVVANRPDAAAEIATHAQIEHELHHLHDETSLLGAGPFGALHRGLDILVVQLASPDGLLPTAVLFGAFAGGVLLAIWLGIGLTSMGVLAIGWGIAWPLMLGPSTRSWGQVLLGLVPLVLGFVTLLQGARAVLSRPTPVAAIARNVLTEAVRMKISIVFIVMILLLLALIPASLTEDQPLRYRVQQWMQYGLGFSTLFLALLTVFLSVATVAFEQRDRTIWQTATKPVAHWQYILGKWSGVMAVNLILLIVTAGGVYLFTEYLRRQPANGESAHFVDLQGNSTRSAFANRSNDRRILEDQVLVARVSAMPEPFRPEGLGLEFRIDRALDQMPESTDGDRARLRETLIAEYEAALDQLVEMEILDRRSRNARLSVTDALTSEIRAEKAAQFEVQFRAIEPGGFREFVFDASGAHEEWLGIASRVEARVNNEVQRRIDAGLAEDSDREALVNQIALELERENKLPAIPTLTLRYKVNAGSNDPAAIYRVQFFFNGIPYPQNRATGAPIATESGLKITQTLTFPVGLLDDQGRAIIGIASDPANERTITFGPGGLELLHAVGGYETNFLRVIAVIWIKLGFIAAVGVCAATFLSFSVASLVTLGILVMAASARFLLDSLAYYDAVSIEGDLQIHRVLVRAISLPIANAFRIYADLKPTERLVEGRLLPWSAVATALVVIATISAAVLGLAYAIFRRRELAIYSGS